MDILSTIWELYTNFANDLPPSVFSFLLRANLLLLCPVIAAYIGFSQLRLRNRRLLAVLMGIGALVAFSIPLNWFTAPSALRPWLIIVLLCGCWYLPVIFSLLAHPQQGVQENVLKITRIILFILFVLNLIFWR